MPAIVMTPAVKDFDHKREGADSFTKFDRTSQQDDQHRL